MNKEYIYDLLNRLDLQEWCTELYKVPLTWCELYDIRDYIINLEQQVKKQKEVIDEAIEYMKDFIFEPLLTNEDRKLIMYNDNLRNFEKILKVVE